MKKLIPGLCALVFLAGCASSESVEMPPVWALGYWLEAEGLSPEALADSVAAIRNLNHCGDVFLTGETAFSAEQATALHDAKAHTAGSGAGADVPVCEAPSEDMLKAMRKAGARPFVLGSEAEQASGAVGCRFSAGEGWEALGSGLRKGLELSAQGVRFWQMSVDCGNDAELAVRNAQLQSFLPLPCSRLGIALSQEELGAMAMRYRMMPHVYTLAASGELMTMAVGEVYADAAQASDEFLLGPDILVCPVLEPGVSERQVYFPAGRQWYDISSESMYEGGTSATVPAPLGDIPVFCASGSIMVGSMGNTHYFSRSGSLVLFIYPGADADCCFYSDMGDGTGYTKGELCRTHIHWNDAEHLISFSQEGSFEGMRKSLEIGAIAVGKGSRFFPYPGGNYTNQVY